MGLLISMVNLPILRGWLCGGAYHKADGNGQGGGKDGTDNQGAVRALFGLAGGLLMSYGGKVIGVSMGSAEASEL